MQVKQPVKAKQVVTDAVACRICNDFLQIE